ncbi:MAG: DUF4157 domain-containing protein [Leptolyngbyaceae cyanobacterium MO_188.B28]|nr:DUF4157 domain-containing protein [Leptolyngbyaceae cyanobacterium MO_188.B28]
MSESKYDLTRVQVPASDFNPGNQLPGRPFVVQAKTQSSKSSNSSRSVTRMQQLDAGVLQTLNIQAKLSIGAVGDKYEQEADQVAAQVVDHINSPQVQQQSIQREELPKEEEELQMKPLAQGIQREELPKEEEELQMKPLAQGIQREELPKEEEELQMKPLAQGIQREELPKEEEELQMKPLVQRQMDQGGVASADLEASLETARGRGQPLGDGVRAPMEQAFGADFSGVRVHADAQSDSLNQSIQARAFTTGQDVFFRQGEYQPGSRGGQELLAHELTHVVQQNGGAVQPKEQR